MFLGRAVTTTAAGLLQRSRVRLSLLPRVKAARPTLHLASRAIMTSPVHSHYNREDLNRYAHAHAGYFPDDVPQAEFAEKFDHQSRDGSTRLQGFRTLPPDGAVRGIMFVWPGLNEHVNRSAHWAAAFAERGFAAYGMDYPGFGASDGHRAFISDFGELMREVLHFVETVRQRHPDGTPCFIAGQSLGGAMTLRCCIERPDLFGGAVILCPAIQSDLRPWLQSIASLLGWLAPRLPVAKLGELDMTAKNLAVPELVDIDPMVYRGKMLAGTGAALVAGIRFLSANLSRMQTPFLLLQGEMDMVCNPEGARRLMRESSSADKTLRMHPEAWHDLIHDLGHADVLRETADWAEDRLRRVLAGEDMPVTSAEEIEKQLRKAEEAAEEEAEHLAQPDETDARRV